MIFTGAPAEDPPPGAAAGDLLLSLLQADKATSGRTSAAARRVRSVLMDASIKARKGVWA
nr:hypothetical protein GCM10020063_064230 [Dactylosporangium thailandense]